MIGAQDENDGGVVTFGGGNGGNGELVGLEEMALFVGGIGGRFAEAEGWEGGAELLLEAAEVDAGGLHGEEEDVFGANGFVAKLADDFGGDPVDFGGMVGEGMDDRGLVVTDGEMDEEVLGGLFDEAVFFEIGDVGVGAGLDALGGGGLGAKENVEGEFDNLAAVAIAGAHNAAALAEQVEAEVTPDGAGMAVEILGVVVEGN